MAYKKIYKKKIYKRGKQSWYDKKYSAKDIAIQALQNTRYLKGLVNSEMLHNDITFSSDSITNTGSSVALTNIAQNDTVGGRTGNSILVRNITLRLSFEVNSAVTGDTRIRFILLQDSQQVSDTGPSWTDVMSNSTPESLLATGTFGRFKILMSKSFSLTPASGGFNTRWVTKYLKTYSHVRYNGTASSDIQKNGLYFLVIGSEATNTPTLRGTIRIGYHDN